MATDAWPWLKTPVVLLAAGVAPPPSSTTLQSLVLTANSFTVGNPQGTLIGLVLNTDSSGLSIVTLSSVNVANALQLANVAGVWQLQVGSAPPIVPATITFNLIETLSTATNSPKTTTGFVVNENAVSGASGLQLALIIDVNALPIAA